MLYVDPPANHPLQRPGRFFFAFLDAVHFHRLLHMGGLGGEVGQTVSKLPGQPTSDIDGGEPLSENFSVADELDVRTTTGDRYGDMLEFVQGDTPAPNGDSPDSGSRLHSFWNNKLKSVSISG